MQGVPDLLGPEETRENDTRQKSDDRPEYSPPPPAKKPLRLHDIFKQAFYDNAEGER